MIEHKVGDIFEEDVEALVNSVNCVGVMGRGIALQFKNRYPENFKAYAQACKRDEVKPGRMFIYESGTMTNPRYIINFPTKRHWRGKSRMEDIETGLSDLSPRGSSTADTIDRHSPAWFEPGWTGLERCPSAHWDDA